MSLASSHSAFQRNAFQFSAFQIAPLAVTGRGPTHGALPPERGGKKRRYRETQDEQRSAEWWRKQKELVENPPEPEPEYQEPEIVLAEPFVEGPKPTSRDLIAALGRPDAPTALDLSKQIEAAARKLEALRQDEDDVEILLIS